MLYAREAKEGGGEGAPGGTEEPSAPAGPAAEEPRPDRSSGLWTPPGAS